MIGVAKPCGELDQRIEHGLQIEVERLMTLSTSAVAVCCWSKDGAPSSLRRRMFSMAMTAWAANLSPARSVYR